MVATPVSDDPNAGLGEILHAMWSSVAPSWAAHADHVDARDVAVTEAMLHAASVRSGDRVLELACGPGGVGLAAAERVGPDGWVVLSDVSAEMAAIAEARARGRGLSNVTVERRDLSMIDEPDGSFDVVLCREGLMLVPDAGRAAAEVVRVLRLGGRAAVAVWGPRARNPWLGLLFDAVTDRTGMPVPPDGVPGPFSLDDADRLAAVLTRAGLVEVEVREVPVPFVASSLEEWWEMVPALAGPLAAVLGGLPDDVRDGIRSDAATSLEPFAVAGGGYVIPGVSLVAGATSPSV